MTYTEWEPASFEEDEIGQGDEESAETHNPSGEDVQETIQEGGDEQEEHETDEDVSKSEHEEEDHSEDEGKYESELEEDWLQDDFTNEEDILLIDALQNAAIDLLDSRNLAMVLCISAILTVT